MSQILAVQDMRIQRHSAGLYRVHEAPLEFAVAMQIYLVLHHEIGGTDDDPRADEMVFYTASSLQEALRLIRISYVARWSWWEIQVHTLNNSDWPEHVGYYSRRGGKLKQPPYEKCVDLFRQRSADRR